MVAIADLKGSIRVAGQLVQPLWGVVNGLSVAGYKINICGFYLPVWN